MMHDAVAFVAIGSGARHAESQFMVAGHAWSIPAPESLFVTYSAKKNAEIAPGVGRETDMFAMGPYVGQMTRISDDITSKLDVEYQKIVAKDRKVRDKAKKEMARYVQELGAKAAQSQAKPPEAEGEAAPSVPQT
jgi:hypothetical protein